MISPMGTRVLVSLMKIEETKTPGGVILPSPINQGLDERESVTGQVIAIGPECERIKVDTIVLVSQYLGDIVHYENQTFRIMDEAVVLATIDD